MSDYSKKLKDPRWQKKRLKILERDNWKCQECGSTRKQLQVHHEFYLYKVEPWNHPDDLLTTLCDECHKIRQAAQEVLHVAIAKNLRRIPTQRLEKMLWWLLQRAETELEWE